MTAIESSREARNQTIVPAAASETEWWRGAVIYQVYPRSFLDTTDDGVGDLKGVLKGLDYIASLGVDAVWLSPFFKSPMDDFGYDVSDYRAVDPIFGDLDDFDAIVKKAHGLGLRVIIDQVYSHTSDQHAWFQESRTDRNNAKADWYVWADPKPDGTPPNNWQSVFGGSAWEWDSRRRQYYFHNFLRSQPDLNLHNKDVQDALLDVARFWLDRGVDGFRLDAINFAMHDLQLRDNPPAPRDGRELTRPFEYQDHIYSQSHPDIPKFLERIRRVTNDYDDVFTVAEVGGPHPLAEMKAFTADSIRLNSAYDFSFLYADKISGDLICSVLGDWRGEPGEGWPSWAFSNHDAPRAVSRWASQKDINRAARVYLMLLMSLRGNAILYQGEELGLVQAEIPFSALKDPEAIANWPHTLGRDGARTPMPWRAEAKNLGFSNGEPWLPLDGRHAAMAVASQDAEPDSILNYTRALVGLRSRSPALRKGARSIVAHEGDFLAIECSCAHETVLCVFNFSDKTVDWKPANASQYEQLVQSGLDGADESVPHQVPALSAYFARRKN